MRRRRKNILPWLAWLILYAAAASILCAGIQPLSPGESIHGFAALIHGVLAGHDTIGHDYPAAWWGWREIQRTGDIPLWNPSWFCGEPFIASQTFLPFYPFNWLMGILPLPLGFNIQYPLHLILAATAMLWTCRRRALGWWAAGFAGLAWGFGGHLATLVGPGHMQKLQTLAWLPLTVYGIGALATRRPRRGIFPAATGMTMQILAGHPQILYLSLIGGGLEFLMRNAECGMRNWKAGKSIFRHFNISNFSSFFSSFFSSLSSSSNSAFRIPHSAFRILLLVLLLPAVLWLSTAEFARLSNRQGALSWVDATRGSLPPEEAFEFILPRLKGDSMPHGRGAYVGRLGTSPTSSPERMTSDYIGAGTLLLALLALVLPGRRRAAAGYWVLAALALFMSLGGFIGEFYAILLKIIPGLSHFRAPSAMMALLAYAFAMAAALGMDAWQATFSKYKRTFWVQVPFYFWSVFAMVSFILFLPRALNGPDLFLYAWLHSILAIFFLMGPIGLAYSGHFLTRRDKLPIEKLRIFTVRITNLLFPLIAIVDLTVNARPFWNAIDARPYTAYMQSHWALPYFTRSDGHDPARYIEPGGELKNWALTYTDYSEGRVVSTLTGYHPVAYQNYYRIVDALGFTNPTLLKLFDVAWAIVPDNFKTIDAAAQAGFDIAGRQAGQALLHNAGIHYIRPAGTLKLSGAAALLADLKDPKFDPDQTTLVESPRIRDEFPVNRFDMEYSVENASPGEIQIHFRSKARGMIVVSEPAVPGWRAELRKDSPNAANSASRSLPIEKANGYFMLLGPVEAGRGILRLTYDPASQRLGLYLTLFGLALIGYHSGRAMGARFSKSARGRWTQATPSPGSSDPSILRVRKRRSGRH